MFYTQTWMLQVYCEISSVDYNHGLLSLTWQKKTSSLQQDTVLLKKMQAKKTIIQGRGSSTSGSSTLEIKLCNL